MAVNPALTTLLNDEPMTASFQSDIIELSRKGAFSIHAVFTGSPVGTLYIAVSIDGVNFILLPDSSQAVSAAGEVFYNINQAGYKMARLHYTFTSGSGSLDAYFSTKDSV